MSIPTPRGLRGALAGSGWKTLFDQNSANKICCGVNSDFAAMHFVPELEYDDIE